MRNGRGGRNAEQRSHRAGDRNSRELPGGPSLDCGAPAPLSHLWSRAKIAAEAAPTEGDGSSHRTSPVEAPLGAISPGIFSENPGGIPERNKGTHPRGRREKGAPPGGQHRTLGSRGVVAPFKSLQRGHQRSGGSHGHPSEDSPPHRSRFARSIQTVRAMEKAHLRSNRGSPCRGKDGTGRTTGNRISPGKVEINPKGHPCDRRHPRGKARTVPRAWTTVKPLP